MLSRIAESLFWIGRYIERADDTARILDVHIHNLLEAPVINEAAACAKLLDAMGIAVRGAPPVEAAPEGEGAPAPVARSDAGNAAGGEDEADRASGAPATRTLSGAAATRVAELSLGEELDAQVVTELLAFDEDNPSSIVASLAAARANARGVSEAISSEMWEALNATYNALPGQVGLGRRVGPYGFFRYVRERAAIMAGLTESTMSRDDAWRFLVLGRSLERVDMLARLLSTAVTRPGDDEGEADWVVLLRSCSAHEAFLRTYSREPEPTLAAEFMLLDRLFPRSVFCALSTAEERLTELEPPSGRAGTTDEARRIVGLVRTNLEFRRIEDLLEDLPGQLNAIQTACGAASAALATRYFRQTMPIEWTLEGTGLEVVPAEEAAR